MMFWGLKPETKIIRYSPEQLFAVVAAVDMYEGFIPWCQRSEIIRRHPDGSFDADLEIGFKFLVESYVSHVVLDKPKFIKVHFSLRQTSNSPYISSLNLHILFFMVKLFISFGILLYWVIECGNTLCMHIEWLNLSC